MNFTLIKTKIFISPKHAALIGVLFVNIAFGMQNLVLSKMLYDTTKQASAFAFILTIDFGVTCILQLFAGAIVDRNKPILVVALCNFLIGLLIISSSFALNIRLEILYIYLTTFLISSIKPFFRAAQFATGPSLINKEELSKYNGTSAIMVQAGQIAGVAAVSPLLLYFGPIRSYFFIGIFHLLASFSSFLSYRRFTRLVKTNGSQRSFKNEINLRRNRLLSSIEFIFKDTFEILKLLIQKKMIVAHLLIGLGDLLCVSMFNVFLVPLSTQRFGDIPYSLSIIDGGFAFGAIISGHYFSKWFSRLNVSNSILFFLFCSSFSLFLISTSFNLYLTFFSTALLGVCTTFSVGMIVTTLQKRTAEMAHGRIGAIRQLILSVVAALVIPNYSRIVDVDLSKSILISSLMMFSFFLTILYLSKFRLTKNLFED